MDTNSVKTFILLGFVRLMLFFCWKKDMEWIEMPFSNGIRVIDFIDKPIQYGFAKIVYYNALLRVEKPGLLHFFEHVVCKQFYKTPEKKRCLFIEASTGIDLEFHFNLFKGRENIIRNFIDVINNFELTEEELESEKGVIMNEIEGDYYDEYFGKNMKCIMGEIGSSSYILGTVDDVRSITLEDIKEAQRIISEMPPIICVFGLDKRNIITSLDSLYYPVKGKSEVMNLYQRHLFEVKRGFYDTREGGEEDNDMDLVYINWLLPNSIGKDMFMIEIINKYISNSAMDDSLDSLLVRKGLSYSISAEVCEQAGLLFNCMKIACYNKYVDQVIGIIKKYMNHFRSDLIILPDDMIRLREEMTIVKYIVNNNLENKYMTSINRFIDGFFRDPDDDIKVVNQMDYKDISNAAIIYLNEDNMTITVI